MPQCGFLGREDMPRLGRRLVRRAAQTSRPTTGRGGCPIKLRRSDERRLIADGVPRPLAGLMLVLTVLTRIVDAVSILGLGRAFGADMTTSSFIGLAVAGASGFLLSPRSPPSSASHAVPAQPPQASALSRQWNPRSKRWNRSVQARRAARRSPMRAASVQTWVAGQLLGRGGLERPS
jgi:hypothetical protein